MRIIPAIDIINGKCVRLTRGDYSTKKIYADDPLEMAKQFEDNGIKYLHLVDLDGAKANTIINYNVLEKIANQTNLKIDFGGGLKTTADATIAFNSGAYQITGGSIAVKYPSVFLEWLEQFGSDKIILGADCIDNKIATNGWLEHSDLDVIEFINAYQQKGLQSVICTAIENDGMLAGTADDLYRKILAETNIDLIASGGVNNLENLLELKSMGCEGAIVGKAFYEGRISLKQLSTLC
ncbi:1-(5-phosphoribosyl)-5-[(5-phosphoribosylamino)methylideneamino]imidazole-4-carboxamide isomerase [Crocinitomix catalasitica]|uniref:1-(5-phosphoribosyl)-5-[(5- phosphoribosylamino)methylideneamino]imidazole-4- carboxamide isomerase n=1 Tax=Crocinitomix catalasitica TaxID=184607 RepID=UPI0004895114|nr:1-(5-phosphoribosyl)-5-[(5-phosphoribosylamino)methylideneamino]imidazole-4-carboxamide isomerase [Crocinitomix catalasitica]